MPVVRNRKETQMRNSDQCHWGSHIFTVLPHSAQWHDCAGIYIFASQVQSGRWKAYYIGQCHSFADRIPSHDQWDAARRCGATHIHALVVPQQDERDKIEQQLIQMFQPPLNTQLR